MCSRTHVAAPPALNARKVAPAPPRACIGAPCAHSHPRPLQPRVACPAPCPQGCLLGARGCHIESVRPNTTNRIYQPLHAVHSCADLRPTTCKLFTFTFTAAVASLHSPSPTSPPQQAHHVNDRTVPTSPTHVTTCNKFQTYLRMIPAPNQRRRF